MNQKILIGAALLSVLALTTTFVFLREKSQVEATQVKATFGEWQSCLKEKNWNPFCDMYKNDPTQFDKCQNVKAQISYCENGNAQCQRFFMYFEEPDLDAPLPQCFYDCTSACHYYATGNAGAEQNYNIDHFECAYEN